MDPCAMGSALTQKAGVPQLTWSSQANLTGLSMSLSWIKREPQGSPGQSLFLKRMSTQVWVRCKAELPRGLPLKFLDEWDNSCAEVASQQSSLMAGDEGSIELLDIRGAQRVEICAQLALEPGTTIGQRRARVAQGVAAVQALLAHSLRGKKSRGHPTHPKMCAKYLTGQANCSLSAKHRYLFGSQAADAAVTSLPRPQEWPDDSLSKEHPEAAQLSSYLQGPSITLRERAVVGRVGI